MKNRIGLISGFILGVSGFLFMFKVIFLDNIPPEDELAPGIVVITAVFFGFILAFIGYWIQNYFVKKRNSQL